MSNGWPLGLEIMNARIQVRESSHPAPAVEPYSIHEHTINFSTFSSAYLDTEDDSSRTEGRLAALEEEIRLLRAASRRNNFDIHNLESKVQDSEDRLEEATSQVEKLRAMNAQRQLRFTRCTFLKFVNDLSGKHSPKLFGMLDSYVSGKWSTSSSYLSQAVQQFKRFLLALKKFHHELQGFIKQEMVKNELTAALANEELVFFVASALIAYPVLAAWMLLSSQFS